MYGDSILCAHVTAAQSLHVQKVRILLIRDFEYILLSHDMLMVLYMILMPTWMSKCSCHSSKCLLKHKEMFSKVKFWNCWNYLRINMIMMLSVLF